MVALLLVLVGIVGLVVIPFGYVCVGFAGDRTYWWITGFGVGIDLSVVYVAWTLNRGK